MDKHPVVHPYKGILLNNTKKLLGEANGYNYRDSAQGYFGVTELPCILNVGVVT